MNWDNARYFLAIARAGSLRAAATSLNVDQATVARRVRALEQELNTTLFSRKRDGYSLTAAGHHLLFDAEGMEAAAKTLMRKSLGLDSQATGNVHIASTDTLARFFILPAMHRLKELYPDVTITLSTAAELVDIRKGEADLAIRAVRPSDPDLISRRLAGFTLGLYASKEYLEAKGFPTPGNAFMGHDLIMFPQRSVPQYWRSLCGETITNAQIVLQTRSHWTYVEAIRQGLGIGMMAQEVVDACCPELVNAMPARTECIDIWLVINPEVRASGRVQAFLTALNEILDKTKLHQTKNPSHC